MSNVIDSLLAAFDELPISDQMEVLKEMKRRIVNRHESDSLSDDDLACLADELFQMYDEEERRNAR